MAPEMALFEKPSYSITEIRPFVSGDLAYATYSWAMDVTVLSKEFEGGRHPVSMKGKGTAVLSRAVTDAGRGCRTSSGARPVRGCGSRRFQRFRSTTTWDERCG